MINELETIAKLLEDQAMVHRAEAMTAASQGRGSGGLHALAREKEAEARRIRDEIKRREAAGQAPVDRRSA